MTSLSYARCADEIAAQGRSLGAAVADADMSTRVPSCPEWDLAQLLRHVGRVQRWAEEIVRTRRTEPVPEDFFPRLAEEEKQREDAGALGPWVAEGAERLAETLRATDPATPLFSPGPPGSAGFYARRFAHETLIHRADAVLALGGEFAPEREVALDALDEWFELGSLPFHFEVHPQVRELLGPGNSVHLHATDTDPEARAEWVADLTGEALTWRRSHEKARVAVRGPLTELLLLVYRRRAADTPGRPPTEVLGDAEFLHFWLERVAFN
jgi:uncharacterized protein (TIGR03083 family)